MDLNVNVSPTKGNLIQTKKSLELADKGYELMDRKRNILVREMMGLIDRAGALRERIDNTYSTAYQALQNAQITLGVCESIAESIPVDNGLSISFRSVMGVELPSVKLAELSHDSDGDGEFDICYDMSSSNAAFDEAFISFQRVKYMLAELAEVENCVYRLAVAINKTQSRANALKNIIIPNLSAAQKYITDALDEKEREEFSRLKVIKKDKSGINK